MCQKKKSKRDTMWPRFLLRLNFMYFFFPKKLQQKKKKKKMQNLDLSPEVHRQVQDVVGCDDGTGGPVGARALLVEQTDHIAAPAHMINR